MILWLGVLLGCGSLGPEQVVGTYVELLTRPGGEPAARHLLEPGCSRTHTVEFGQVDLVTPRLVSRSDDTAEVDAVVAFYADQGGGEVVRLVGGLRLGARKVDGLWWVECPADSVPEAMQKIDLLEELRR